MSESARKAELSVVSGGGTELRAPETIAAQIEIVIADTLRNCIFLGELLRELKAATAHGEWLNYLDRFGFVERKAQNLILLAKTFQSRDMREIAGLGPTKALLLIRRLPKSQLDRLIEEGTCEVITLDKAKSSTIRQLEEALAHLKAVRKHNKKLTVLQEENKELKAEVEAYQGKRLAPTVKNAQQQARMAADRLDEACAALLRIAVPDDEDAAAKGKVLNIITATVAGAQNQLQNVMATQVDPHLPG